MIKFFKLLGVLLICAFDVNAAPVAVQSGEHDGFTRLVLTLPETTTGWELGEKSGAHTVTIDDREAEFSISDVFSRIPRTRLASIHAEPNTGVLELTLGCRCQVNAYRFGAAYLVIDISDTLAGDLDENTQIVSPTLSFGTGYSEKTELKTMLDFGESEVISSVEPEPRENSNSSAARSIEELLPLNDYLAQQRDVRPAQNLLVEQLGRAASLGLLKPTQSLGMNEVATKETAPVSGEEGVLQAAQSMPKVRNINLTAQSSVDRDLSEAVGRLQGERASNECKSLISFTGNIGADEVTEQIGNLRGQLMGEFDEIQQDAVLQLSTIYLGLGFGAEARQILALVELSGHEITVRKAIADIMDYGQVLNFNPFEGKSNCETSVAMWSVLSKKMPDNRYPINSTSVMRTFSALPLHLRVHLGPMLSERLLLAGDKDSAKYILKLIERAIPNPDHHFDMAEARLDQAQGDIASATRELKSIVNSETDLSPHALVDLIDTYHEQGIPISQDTAALVGAFVLEHRNSPIGVKLRRAHALARARAGQFDTAYNALVEIADRDGSQNAVVTRSEVTGVLISEADEYTFIENIVLNVIEPELDIATVYQNSAAERLIGASFPEQALQLIERAAIAPHDRTRKLLRARATLMMQRPRQAEVHLMGLEGHDVDTLRASARFQAEDFETAIDLYEGLSDGESAERSAWLAGNWEKLEASQTDLYKQISTIMRVQSKPTSLADENSTPVIGVLAANRALLQKSVSARATLNGLLNLHSIDASSLE